MAVVDAETGRLVGNVSSSDLRMIGHTASSVSVLHKVRQRCVCVLRFLRDLSAELRGVFGGRPRVIAHQDGSVRAAQRHFL